MRGRKGRSRRRRGGEDGEGAKLREGEERRGEERRGDGREGERCRDISRCTNVQHIPTNNYVVLPSNQM